jgi:hypothetical protein
VNQTPSHRATIFCQPPEQLPLGASDTINDFSVAQGDMLNIKDILVGYNPMQSLIDDFVSFTTNGSNTIMSVDRDGTGTAYNSQSVATISSVTGLDADTMLANSSLVVT